MPIPPRRFILHSPIRNLDTFRAFAEQAVQLQAHGDVAINISTLADKGWYELPPGGSPWHEYARFMNGKRVTTISILPGVE